MKDLTEQIYDELNAQVVRLLNDSMKKTARIVEQASRIAELEEQLEDAEAMIAQVSHGAAERISAIESECYALRQALRPPKIEDSHAWRAVPWKHLGKIMGLIDPEPIQIDGQTRVFQNPYAHEALREISRLVRAMMAEPVPEASAPPMTYAAAKAEQDSSLISILIDASQDGNTYPKSDYMRWCKRAADALSTALQAPVREVPEGWQPIATAPYHKPILLWWRTCKTPSIGQWYSDGDSLDPNKEGWRCDGDQCIPTNQEDCTHWMPLPEAPVQEPKP